MPSVTELLCLGGIGEFDERQQHTELGRASVNRHKGCHRDQGSNPDIRNSDGTAREILRPATVVEGQEGLAQEIGCQVIDGDVAARQTIFVWLYHVASSSQLWLTFGV